MPSDRSDTSAAVHRLRHEIDNLTVQQTEALETAIYVGMSAEEVKTYEKRRGEILQLMQQLAELEKSR